MKPCPPKVKRESWKAISERIRLKWWTDEAPWLNCGICGKPISHWNDLVVDHIKPGKMGGCKDNSESNLQPAHVVCNFLKGSKRNGNRKH